MFIEEVRIRKYLFGIFVDIKNSWYLLIFYFELGIMYSIL